MDTKDVPVYPRTDFLHRRGSCPYLLGCGRLTFWEPTPQLSGAMCPLLSPWSWSLDQLGCFLVRHFFIANSSLLGKKGKWERMVYGASIEGQTHYQILLPQTQGSSHLPAQLSGDPRWVICHASPRDKSRGWRLRGSQEAGNWAWRLARGHAYFICSFY